MKQRWNLAAHHVQVYTVYSNLKPIYMLAGTYSDVLQLLCFELICFCICPGVCSTKEIQYDEGKIDFYPFHFMFPAGS